MTKTKVQIRASEEQVKIWREAAYIRGVSLSEWMRKILDANAHKVVEESK